ncbi:hypothetical protein BD779DRAFT_1163234 [Infundibulicybe gibba]|nr:hypothetical protein BD779DRAFT_1163234 [Infundibulicybe gibba]
MAQAADAIPSLDSTMGAMLIGVIASAVLYGVSCVQTFYYFTYYPNDRWYIKTIVPIILFFDTVHLCLVSHTMYHYLVSNYDQPASLEIIVWSIVLESLFTGATAVLVQGFYAMRVWRMSHGSRFLTGLIIVLVLSNAGCSIAWVTLALGCQTFTKLLVISPLTITINAFTVVIDVLIAGTLCVLLYRARTGFKKSDSIINRLMIFVVNTGVLTSCCAIASLFSLLLSPNTLIYATFYFCIGRLYTNSLLATLNARKTMLDGNVTYISHKMASLPPNTATSNTPMSSQSAKKCISIRIDTEQEVDRDDEYQTPSPTKNEGEGQV